MNPKQKTLKLLLAWALMCCSYKPPLYPTTTSIIFITALLGKCKMGDYMELLGCGEATIRSMVCRLREQGVLQTEWVNVNGRHAVYELGKSGVFMVRRWLELTGIYQERINNKTLRNNDK